MAGCAAPRTDPAPGAVAARPAGQGVVVAIRPVSGQAGARVLGLVGASPGARGAVEVIVRADEGQTLSVVQADAQGLRPGQRVALSRGARTAIAVAAP